MRGGEAAEEQSSQVGIICCCDSLRPCNKKYRPLPLAVLSSNFLFWCLTSSANRRTDTVALRVLEAFRLAGNSNGADGEVDLAIRAYRSANPRCPALSSAKMMQQQAWCLRRCLNNP